VKKKAEALPKTRHEPFASVRLLEIDLEPNLALKNEGTDEQSPDQAGNKYF